MKAAETQRAKLIDLIVQAEMVAPSSYMKGRPSSFLSRRFSEMISAHCATLCIRWIGGTVLCMDWKPRLRRDCLLDNARLLPCGDIAHWARPLADTTGAS